MRHGWIDMVRAKRAAGAVVTGTRRQHPEASSILEAKAAAGKDRIIKKRKTAAVRSYECRGIRCRERLMRGMMEKA